MVKNHKTADSIFKFNAPGPKPNGLQASEDGLWIIDQGNSHIYKVDWDNGEVIHDIPTETEHPSGITIGDGYAWVSSTFSLEIFQTINILKDTLIDSRRGDIVTTGIKKIYK